MDTATNTEYGLAGCAVEQRQTARAETSTEAERDLGYPDSTTA
jgi:hypothetical protein